MKKLLASFFAVLAVITLTGCGKETTKLNLENIKKEVEAIKTTEISRTNMVYALQSQEEFLEVTELYDFDLKEKKISKKNIAENDGMYDFTLAYNSKSKVGFFIGKPAEGKEEALTKELKTFFKKYDYKIDKVGEYLVVVASSDNDATIQTIKDNQNPSLYAGLVYNDTETVLGKENVEKVEEAIFAQPAFMTSSAQYIIVKPSKGNKDEVKKLMDKYMSDLQTQWDTYLPDQAELVKNRLETTIGDYLIYIISNDNEAVLKTIKNNIEE